VRSLLKIFLPYTLLAGIGIAIWVSCNRPGIEPIVVDADVGDSSKVTCSFCSSQLDPENAVVEQSDAATHYFCCDHCRGSYLAGEEGPSNGRDDSGGASSENTVHRTKGLVDPICYMDVNPAWGFEAQYKGESYFFCSERCRRRFAESPEDYLGDRCVVCKDLLQPAGVKTATSTACGSQAVLRLTSSATARKPSSAKFRYWWA